LKLASKIAFTSLMALALCAQAQDPKNDAATRNATLCKPPPKEVVIRDMELGNGDTARYRTAVLMGYTGWLYDGCAKDLKGQKFDSSENRSTPFGFMVGAGRVVKGWDEGVIGMKEHGKRLLIIPADKAYGAAGGPGGQIPPNTALVFEVELSKILQQADGK
jgi:FKBP-type peptidyl-prolyl cis-trans isomerase FkpA